MDPMGASVHHYCLHYPHCVDSRDLSTRYQETRLQESQRVALQPTKARAPLGICDNQPLSPGTHAVYGTNHNLHLPLRRHQLWRFVQLLCCRTIYI